MASGLSVTVQRKRIASFMASMPEEFEVLEDMLGEDSPSIQLQTKTRILTLSCDEHGKVVEDFKMREGAGSKEDYLKKEEAYKAVSSYYNDYYTGAKVSKNSFEEGIIKIELSDRVVTLSYDAKNKLVEEKDRARRTPKPRPSIEEELASLTKEEKEFEQMSIFDIPAESPLAEKKPEQKPTVNAEVDIYEKNYDRWVDGTIVKNICNNKKYKVRKDQGNIIEVYDPDHGYLIMARADLKVIESL